MSISIENVSAGYGNKIIVRDIDISFSETGVYVIIGPNGSGKSTLLRITAGVLEPIRGDVLINGISIFKNHEVKRLIGYLPADLGLIRRLTLYENIKFFLELLGFNRDFIEERLAYLEAVLRINDILHLKVGGMSTGQRARAGLARSIAHDPKILVLDEPTRGLDVFFAKQVRELLRIVARDKVVVMTTHLIHEVLELGNYIVVLRGGRIIFRGTASEFRNVLVNKPLSIYIRTSTEVDEVFKSMNLEFEKRGYEDYVVKLPDLGHIPVVVRELVQHTSIIEFREDIDELVKSIYEG